MKFRTLGKTGLNVSVVGIGAWQFGGEWGVDYSQAEVDAIVDAGRDCGINFIDTAECYGDHLSERLVGEAVKRDREKWIIATKFGHKFTGHLERTRHWTPEEVLIQLEDSLRALQTDHVDIYQFHSGDDAEFATPGLWDMLNEQVAAGKIRHLGISIGSNGNIAQTEDAASVNAEVIQVVYNRLDLKPEADVLPSCQKQNLGVLARVPLASGYLSGKYQPGVTFPPNDVRASRNAEAERRKLELVQQIKANEVPPGIDMAAWALAWCLKHPAVTCVIPGCKTPKQVISNASAADLDMVSPTHPQAS